VSFIYLYHYIFKEGIFDMSMYNDYNRHDFCPTDLGHPNDHHCPAGCCPCPTLSRIRRVNTRTSATGSIIPFSSGIVPVALTTVLGGLISTTSLVGFGTSTPGVAIVGNTLPLIPPALSEDFTVPRDGVITSLAAHFTTTVALTLTTPVTIVAQLFSAPPDSNTFTAVPGAIVPLTPALTGVLAIGTTVNGIVTLSEPVTAQTRLLLVFYAVSTGFSIATAIIGNASAGVAIR
jgi:BclB C-terminal domain-containing protein